MQFTPGPRPPYLWQKEVFAPAISYFASAVPRETDDKLSCLRPPTPPPLIFLRETPPPPPICRRRVSSNDDGQGYRPPFFFGNPLFHLLCSD